MVDRKLQFHPEALAEESVKATVHMPLSACDRMRLIRVAL